MQTSQKPPIGLPVSWRWVALALLAGAAQAAQSQAAGEESGPPLPVPGEVLSDVQPLPAEHRDSSGAVLLTDSPVRAQRAFEAAARRTGVTSAIGHNVSRLLERARSWDDVREAEAVDAAPPPVPQQAQ